MCRNVIYQSALRGGKVEAEGGKNAGVVGGEGYGGADFVEQVRGFEDLWLVVR